MAQLQRIVHDPDEKSANVIIGGEKLLKAFADARKDGSGSTERVVYRPEYLVSQMRPVMSAMQAENERQRNTMRDLEEKARSATCSLCQKVAT